MKKETLTETDRIALKDCYEEYLNKLKLSELDENFLNFEEFLECFLNEMEFFSRGKE